MADI
jgi:hypothetical protein